MPVPAYQVTGPTKALTATAVSSAVSITPQETVFGFSGQSGPIFLKITNGSADQNVYFQTGLIAQTAVIPVSGGVSGSTPIPAYAEVIVQVTAQSNQPATIYVACVAGASSPVFITPVTLIA